MVLYIDNNDDDDDDHNSKMTLVITIMVTIMMMMLNAILANQNSIQTLFNSKRIVMINFNR